MPRKKNNKKKIKTDDRDDPNKKHKTYFGIIKENDSFIKYYKAQNLVKDDEEFELFIKTLKEPLPSAFRINSACFGQTQALKNIVESNEFSEYTDKDEENSKGIKKLKWYPNQIAYQLNLSRVEIRNSEKLLKLHSFLISESENGYISRQESVSMIPPVVLNVKPHHKVLDLCAAPGSKTAQVIENLCDKNEFIIKDINDKTKGGFIVANDLNNSRCYMLVHQCKRLSLPYFLITNHDASTMPNFYYDDKNGLKKKLKFDRILCDVPCSGDGTLRKNIDIWGKWTPSNGNHFHAIQLKIAKRAAELLEKDGLMVYSTCSFNPMENEAVIANLLIESKGSLELIDIENELKDLKHLHGLEHWTLMQKDLKIVNTIDDVDENFRTQIRSEMFPPKNPENLNLKRCVRVLPHFQNTGGFFIALLKKNTEIMPWEENKKSVDIEKELENEIEKAIKRKRFDKREIGFKEDPFYFLPKDHPEWLTIKEFYGIMDNFPSERLFYRSEKDKKHLCYLSESAIDVFKHNLNHVKFINFGVRLFTKIQDKVALCSHRIAQDGLPLIYPYIKKEKIVCISRDEFEKILKCDEYLEVKELDQKTINELTKFKSGCIIVEYVYSVKYDDGTHKDLKLTFTAWKGKSTIRPFINREERFHFLRIGEFDISSLEAERKDHFDEKQKRRILRTQIKNEDDIKIDE